MKIIYLKWFDANWNSGSYKKEKLPPAEFILEDVGFLVREDKKYITFATEYGIGNQEYKYIHNIPKVNVLEKKIINIKSTEKINDNHTRKTNTKRKTKAK